ncbi:hypothetical protein P8C59_007597 [Phyllachora maydis]|uniref:Reverse transcriptase Ty1/copia-type domain-containing protein n=1 Tax=Phyllachora maydis TaxID=1825666 RepID=A0AAD9MH43_9PEZI|nr:hypothetical protein P8C59_007597 [Phyllachora maydis]
MLSNKEPYLGPAVGNTATSNLDPPIDIGSKEGFKDTITSSIVKELSKKAYTIPDDSKLSGESNFEQWIQALSIVLRALGISNFLENTDISNTYSNSDQVLLLMLLRNSLSSSPRAAISNPAIEAYRAAHMANSSNSTPNSNSNPSKKSKNKKKGKKKASYNIKGQNYSAKSAKQASFILGSYNLAIEEEEEFDSSSNSRYKKRKDFKGKGLKTSSNNKAKYKDNQPRRRPRDPALYNSQLRPVNTGNGPISPAGIGSIILEVLSRKAPPTYTKLILDNVLYLPNININIRNKIVVEIPSNSIRKEDYRPIIEDAIVSEAIEPNKRYKLRNSPAISTTLEGIGPSLRGKRPYRPGKPHNFSSLEGKLVDLDLDLEGAVSPDPSNLNTEKPISIEIGPSKLAPYESSSDSELDEPLPDKPINPVIVESTRPTISIRKPELPEAFPHTIEPIFTPKPIEVIAPNQPITNKPLNNSDLISEGDKIQLDYYKLLAKTSSYILDKRSKWLEAITKEFVQLLELEVFKFLPKSLLPSNRKLITCRNVLKVKKDAKNRPIKYKSRLVARGFIQVEGLDYTITYASTRAFLNSALKEEIYMEIPKGLLDLAASNKAIYKLLLKYGYNPSTSNIIKLSKALYSLKQSPREWQDKLKILLKSLGYLPLISDPGVFYNAKTCHSIVTYIDNCLFIGPNTCYITDLKKRLNKVYAIEDLGPAAYFLGYLNSTKDYSICFSYNGNTVADLGPKLSNSSNTTTKLSRDFHSKEGPRPLTTTSTTIVDSRNSNGSSRTSIINSSLVPIGFSDSDFTEDKATSKSTYGYLYKLAEAIREVQWIIGLFSKLYRPIDYPITLYRDNQGSITVANDPVLYARTKHILLKFRYIREQVKAKIVTIIYLNIKFNNTGYFTAL